MKSLLLRDLGPSKHTDDLHRWITRALTHPGAVFPMTVQCSESRWYHGVLLGVLAKWGQGQSSIGTSDNWWGRALVGPLMAAMPA
jgi:hypothetical protein